MKLLIPTSNITFFIVVFFCTTVFPQSNKSIHQIEHEFYVEKQLLTKENNSNSTIITPISLRKTNKLFKTVFGYYPDWEYKKNAHKNFKYNLLTHIAMFDFKVDSTGSLNKPSGWPWTDFMNEAHSHGVKLIMVVVNFNKTEIHKILTNSTAKWVFMNGVKSLIKQYNLDGINIDFERVDVNDRGTRINSFMQELSDTVHNISSELEVSFAAPPVNWSGWDFEELAASCDYLFIMGYDFFGSWSKTTGPTAPLTGNTHNISNTINIQYNKVVKGTPEKLILGVPYFGPHWETENAQEGSNILYHYENGKKKYNYKAIRFRDAEGEAQAKGLKWSSKYKNSWYSYLSDFVNHQVWFDNDSSLSLKYNFAIAKNLKGIGMWALGYDGTRNELWDLIERKFVKPVAVDKKKKFSNRFSLKQNFPNPFNPTTTIQYSIPVIDGNFTSHNNITLKVYDVLGKEIALLVNEEKIPGDYQVIFKSKNLPSGTYFYQLRVGGFIHTKKMILLR